VRSSAYPSVRTRTSARNAAGPGGRCPGRRRAGRARSPPAVRGRPAGPSVHIGSVSLGQAGQAGKQKGDGAGADGGTTPVGGAVPADLPDAAGGSPSVRSPVLRHRAGRGAHGAGRRGEAVVRGRRPAVDAAGRFHPPRENRPAAPEWPRPGRSVRGPGHRPPQDRDPGARRPTPPFEPSSAAASLRPAAATTPAPRTPASARATPRGPGLWPAAGPSASPPCQDDPGYGDDVRRRVCVVAGFRHRRRTAGTVPGSDGKGGSRCWQR
jgi:hypothetical protein